MSKRRSAAAWAFSLSATVAFLTVVLAGNAFCDTPDQFSITLSSATTGRHEKLEIVCDGITTSYANPFNPDQVSVEGHFTDPDGAEETVYGFWYQAYARSQSGTSEVLTPQGSPHWRVRYAPKKVGAYTCYVSVTDSGGTVQSETKSFTATSSDYPGFLRVSGTNPHYFEFDNGDSFFGIGLDICTDLTPTAETYQYDLYLDELESHGANTFRFWFLNSEIESATSYGHWAWSLQDSQLGADYDMEDAWRLDYLLDQSAEKGIYILVTTMDFSRFMAGEWQNNLYNSANGGPCDVPWDFWTDQIPKQYYRQVLRYLAARWGYSTNVLAWELWNEWHELEWHTSGFNVPEGIAWHQEMGAYLKSADLNHMVTTSMGSFDAYDALWNLSEMDFAQMHGYYYTESRYPWDWWVYGGGQDMFRFIPHFAENTLHYGKPALFGEFGITGGLGQQDELTLQDADAVYLHNGIWSGLMYGMAGTPMAWRWHLFPSHPQWWDHFLGLSNFVEDIQFNNEDFVSLDSVQLTVMNAGFEADTDHWQLWPEDAFSIDSTVHRFTPNSLKFGSSASSTYQINKHHWMLGFNLLPDRQYTLSTWVRTENIGGVHLLVSLSGSSTHQSTTITGTNGWTQLAMDFTTPSSVDGYYLGARVSGPGTVWLDDFKVESRDSVGISDENLRAMALKTNDKAYVWVQNSEHTWYRVAVLGQTPQTISGATLTIPDIDSGGYRVDWWDTYSGTVAASAPVWVDDSNTLTVPIPELQTDIACKITLHPDFDGDRLTYEQEMEAGTDPANPDTDGDGLLDGDEVLPLDGGENPFDPLDPDTTGDNFSNEPDGVPDGQNDYDGDSQSNGYESEYGADPTDPSSIVTHSISGTVTLVGGSASVADVTLHLTGDATDSTHPAEDGRYSFSGLAEGNYTVTPVLAGCEFTPESISHAPLSSSHSGQDFTCHFLDQLPYSPDEPSPSDGQDNVPLETSLVWRCGDPDSDELTFDIYFGDTYPPALLQAGWAPMRQPLLEDRSASRADDQRPMDAWPMYGQNIQRTGKGRESGPTSSENVWRLPLQDPVVAPPAIDPRNTLYAATTRGVVHAIEPDGEITWTYPCGGPLTSSPLISADGTVYAVTDDGTLHAVSGEGEALWSLSIGAPSSCSPAIRSDAREVYVTGEGRLLAIDPQGLVAWTVNLAPGAATSPSVGLSSEIYVGSESGALYRVDNNGSVEWAYQAGGAIRSAPVVCSDGTVYFGCDDGNLYAVGADGALKWAFSTGGPVISSPVVEADGGVYCGSSDANVYALTDRGNLLWSVSVGGPVMCAPALDADGNVFVSTQNGSLCAIDSTGHLKWSQLVQGAQLSSPIVGPGRCVYVGSSDGNLYGFHEAPDEDDARLRPNPGDEAASGLPQLTRIEQIPPNTGFRAAARKDGIYCTYDLPELTRETLYYWRIVASDGEHEALGPGPTEEDVWSFSTSSPPTAAFTVEPTTGTTDTEFNVDASTSFDHEDSIDALVVRWDWEGDGTYDTSFTEVKVASHSYSNTGVYAIGLQVKDTAGLTDEHTREAIVGPSRTGDIDGDGDVDEDDAQIILGVAVGLYYYPGCDVNGDGEVSAMDAIVCLQLGT